MDKSGSRLVVLVDGTDVKHIFASWPQDICLAVCLDPSGDCSMVVFHRQERPAIARDLTAVLGWPTEQTLFVPRVDGFETRQFLYSDERRLMALVSCNPDILEEAHDYTVNYTYALEEGLDPLRMLGNDAPSVDAPPSDEVREVLSKTGRQPVVPDFLRRSAENAKRAKFASVRKVAFAALTG
ncbi:flagellar motor protein [Sulfitobacter sp. JB4-11]|uniref:flagellar motor protein n=1 Tax=Sulfitobacter rhodophyticola TaxID=3238304 RepID=UPI003515EACB